MSDTVDVTPDALDEHATAVHSFMSELQGATANASDTVDPQVYGVVNLPAAQILQVWISSAAGCINQVISAGNGVADAVSAMAAQYRSQDQQSRNSFDSIHNTLGGGGG